jgi:hypothetical protein
VISTSKIKKITAIRKKRIEKGVREKYWGLKPHSKGESFSRSLDDFLPMRELIRIIITETINTIKKMMNIIFLLKTLKLEALCTNYTKNIRSSSIDWYIQK